MILASLLQAWRGRSDSSFDRVMDEFGPALHRMAATYAPAGPARDDLEQEIALAIWRALPRFRGTASLRTYVFRVAQNRCIDLLRRGRAQEWDEPDALAHSGPSPEAITASRQELERVAAALREIPVAQRQSLFLALEGVPHAEIAEVMGVGVSAVAVRIHRARQALQRELGRPEGARHDG